MIIRNDDGLRSRRRTALWVLAGGATLLLAALFGTWWLTRKPTPPKADLFCDMEIVEPGGISGKAFLGDDFAFDHGESQSPLQSRSGKFASLANEKTPYGIGLAFEDLRGGEIVEATVWIYSQTGVGGFIADGDWGFYEGAVPTGEKDGDWLEYQVRAEIPVLLDGKAKLKLYSFNPDPEDAFYDDLSIRRIFKEKQPIADLFPEDSITTVNLLLGEAQLNRIENTRLKALKKGVLQITQEDWVKTKLEYQGNQIPGELRLKGDWTDHLRGDKMSYRIKCRLPNTWLRMVEFSYQNPRSRDFLNEWVLHQWMLREGLLTTRYDFLHLNVNGESKGIYAYEEHFVKQVLEYNGRREGPILKFSEEGFWEAMVRKKAGHEEIDQSISFLEPAQVEAFGMNKVMGDTTLLKEYKVAQNLLNGFKTGELPADQVFDIERTAKYYALCDVTKAWHGLFWHNLRFYYNPVTSRLEPIGFDGYTESGPFVWFPRPFAGYARHPEFVATDAIGKMYHQLFLNRPFMEAYVKALYTYSDPQTVQSLLAGLSKGIEEREKILQAEYAEYQYDRTFQEQHARHLHSLIIPLEQVSVKTYLAGNSNGQIQYQVHNYHCLPVEILGFGKKRNRMDVTLPEPIYLPAYADYPPASFTEISTAKGGERIFFRVPGLDSLFSTEVLPWPKPTNYSPQQDLFKDVKLESNEIYTVEGDSVVRFLPGEHEVRENLLIPAGYRVDFEPGVRLNLLNRAKFISYSPVNMQGTEAEPIEIWSGDQSANGFTVLQAGSRSHLKYVRFRDLNTLNYNGWTLTGAVTFYESDVDITHTEFLNNHCEDGINIVRSYFFMSNVYVANTAFDGFDADFCTGTIKDSQFFQTGNDAMDFSGSQIEVASCKVEQAGDKGLSAGEESSLTVTELDIDGAIIGVASKDLSKVKIQGINLSNAQTGFAAYRKKPEYGPATIDAEGVKMENIKRQHFIEYRSLLRMNGTEIKGEI